MAKGGKSKNAKAAAQAPKNDENVNLNVDSDEELDESVVSPITASGHLLSNPLSYDIKIGAFSLAFHGVNLIVDTELELNCGRRCSSYFIVLSPQSFEIGFFFFGFSVAHANT
jgi:hypothetical protein